MRKSFYVGAIIIIVVLTGLVIFEGSEEAIGTPRGAITNQENYLTIDKDYLLALNTVDQFLGAWLMRDQARGTEFITKRLRDSLTNDQLFAFFVGTSNPHHQGFEVIGNKKINDTTIRFNVWLYEDVTVDQIAPTKRGKPMYVDVVKSSEYIWLVDILPK